MDLTLHFCVLPFEIWLKYLWYLIREILCVLFQDVALHILGTSDRFNTRT